MTGRDRSAEGVVFGSPIKFIFIGPGLDLYYLELGGAEITEKQLLGIELTPKDLFLDYLINLLTLFLGLKMSEYLLQSFLLLPHDLLLFDDHIRRPVSKHLEAYPSDVVPAKELSLAANPVSRIVFVYFLEAVTDA